MDPKDRNAFEDTSVRAGQGPGPRFSVVTNIIHSPSPYRSLALSP